MATASINVDLPLPFSPTKKVILGATSIDFRAAIAGIENGYERSSISALDFRISFSRPARCAGFLATIQESARSAGTERWTATNDNTLLSSTAGRAADGLPRR